MAEKRSLTRTGLGLGLLGDEDDVADGLATEDIGFKGENDERSGLEVVEGSAGGGADRYVVCGEAVFFAGVIADDDVVPGFEDFREEGCAALCDWIEGDIAAGRSFAAGAKETGEEPDNGDGREEAGDGKDEATPWHEISRRGAWCSRGR